MTADKRDTTMPETLPLWPDHDDHPYNIMGDYTYECARADAAMARLRVAVELEKTLRTLPISSNSFENYAQLRNAVVAVLNAIGPIPPKENP